jgi:Taurine catabolism dioxygenase TauD, TfdA family
MDVKKLHAHGWCEIASAGSEDLSGKLLEIGRRLGRPVALRNSIGIVQELVPSQASRFTNSLSAKYKDGEFPMHTDTAHWLTPCRYVVMGCSKEGERRRDTLLFDIAAISMAEDDRLLLMSEPFRIVNGRRSFYGTVLAPDRPFIRYDQGCMFPTSDRGEAAMSLLATLHLGGLRESIRWREGKILVIDNWRVLHGRCSAAGSGSERTIARVLVA